MEKITCLEGPIENVNGKLMLRIPLAAGGKDLIACSHGLGEVDGEFLNIVIQSFIAAHLKISEGTLVVVDNKNGKLNIHRSDSDQKAS